MIAPGGQAMYGTVGRAGRYVLAGSNVVPGTITDVAAGRGIGHGALVSVLLFLAGLFVLLPAGLVAGGVTAARRRNARRTLLQGPMQPIGSVTPGLGPMQPMGFAGPEVAMSSSFQPDQPAPYPPGAEPAAPPAYLQGGPVGFGAAIQEGFRNGFVYRGRASRSAYWWFVLFQVIAEIALELVIFIPLAAINSSGATAVGAIVIGIAFLYLGLVGLALLVRRLHDTDRSGWWVLIALVPFVGPIILLVFTVLEGTPGPNRYQLG